MGIVHFLNVKNGDCSVIQHGTGHVTVIDVCNAREETLFERALEELAKADAGRMRGNFNQKDYPVNPICYLLNHGIKDVFRFILAHPDMDHLDGFKVLCKVFPPTNFWDTDNRKEDPNFRDGSPYNEDDWLYYKQLREGNRDSDPKRLVLYAGDSGRYYNEGPTGGDGLHILAPTPGLMRNARLTNDYNDASYVILYRSPGGRVLFAGDSHDATWEYILEHYAAAVRDVELLTAPHHGRKTGRTYNFLDVVNPAVTLFGNANSDHLAYGAWNYRGLDFITNNQAGCVVIDTDRNPMDVYVTNFAYAQRRNPQTFYSPARQAFYCGAIKPHSLIAFERALASSR